MCNLINIHKYIHTYIHSLIPPWEDQRKWHRMTRMTRPDCAVMCNLINIHTNIHTDIHIFSFVLQRALSFRTRHYLCRQGVALACTRRPHSQGPASVQAHRTGGVTGSEGQEGANGVGGGIGVGGGNGDGNGDVDGHGDGDGAGAGTGVEVNEGAQDGNGDGSGDGAGTGTGTGTGVGTRRRTPDGNGDGNGNGSEDCSGVGTGTTITGTRVGLGRAEGRRKSARSRKIAVDAVRETGETWVESEKNEEKKGLVQ